MVKYRHLSDMMGYHNDVCLWLASPRLLISLSVLPVSGSEVCYRTRPGL